RRPGPARPQGPAHRGHGLAAHPTRAGRATATPVGPARPYPGDTMTSVLSRLPALTRRGGREQTLQLRLTEVAGHLTHTATTVTAWHTLPDQVWAFRPDADREVWLHAAAQQYAGLAGLRLHLRRTTRPFPAADWAVLHQACATPLPDTPGAPSWQQHLTAA